MCHQNDKASKIKTSVEILNDCMHVQADRGKGYDTTGSGQERSFNSIATAFNAIAWKNILEKSEYNKHRAKDGGKKY